MSKTKSEDTHKEKDPSGSIEGRTSVALPASKPNSKTHTPDEKLQPWLGSSGESKAREAVIRAACPTLPKEIVSAVCQTLSVHFQVLLLSPTQTSFALNLKTGEAKQVVNYQPPSKSAPLAFHPHTDEVSFLVTPSGPRKTSDQHLTLYSPIETKKQQRARGPDIGEWSAYCMDTSSTPSHPSGSLFRLFVSKYAHYMNLYQYDLTTGREAKVSHRPVSVDFSYGPHAMVLMERQLYIFTRHLMCRYDLKKHKMLPFVRLQHAKRCTTYNAFWGPGILPFGNPFLLPNYQIGFNTMEIGPLLMLDTKVKEWNYVESENVVGRIYRFFTINKELYGRKICYQHNDNVIDIKKYNDRTKKWSLVFRLQGVKQDYTIVTEHNASPGIHFN